MPSVDDARVSMILGGLEGLMRAAEDLAGEAQRRAPKDEGTLRASVAVVLIVNGARFEGDGAYPAAKTAAAAAARAGAPVVLGAEVSFNTVYAARQHEELDWHHEEGEAKYLEGPLRERAGRYERIITLAAERGSS